MKKVVKDFPILKRKINGKSLVYLDSAAMALKPKKVIKAVDEYYRQYSANVFRGIYRLSERATEEYEKTREKVARLINAQSEKEVIFVRNTTEALNLLAYSWGRLNIDQGDEIMTTILEHHSNFVPWQQLVLENGAVLKVLDIDEQGRLLVDSLKKLVNQKTKLLAITLASNVLGTINPLKKIIRLVKKKNPQILVVVDGAQAVPHLKVDVQGLGADFLAFSGQKMLGPTGAGVLWGKEALLKKMPPFLFGGEMIKEVYLKKSIFAPLPHKFEAGTPHIAGVIGLGAAVDYLTRLGMDKVQKHEKKLTAYALESLSKVANLTLYGPREVAERLAVIAFNVQGIHPHDLAQVLDSENIYVRAGHHCAMPLHHRLGIAASVRASLYLYNQEKDIEKLVAGIKKAKRIFQVK